MSGEGNRLRKPVSLAAGLLTVCVLILAVGTRHWPQISDAVLMHYVVFLLRHGLAPYRQIVDVNLPGSYAVDWAAGRLFGGGAGGWRCFDWAVTAGVGIALTAAGKRAGSAPAGLFAAALFALWHVRDGVAQGGQRDLLVAAFVLLGYAGLLRHARDGSLLSMGIFGLSCGAAATIKPQAAIFWAAALLLGRSGFDGPARRAILASVFGLLLAPAAVCAWLLSYGVFGAFLETFGGLMVYHAGMARHSLPFLLLHALPWQFWPVLLTAILSMHARRSWTGPPQQAALAGIGCGMVSFVAQGKAYPYHRYPLLAFVLLLFAMELGGRLAQPLRRGRADALAQGFLAATLLFSVLWFAPDAAARAARQDWRTTPSLDSLQADLRQLGDAASDRGVQCMDTMAGCITVLDRTGIVQTTGFLYDCYFFTPEPSEVKDGLRARFLAQIANTPPRVFVVTDQWCFDRDPSYARLAQWQAFAALLAREYRLVQDRRFSAPDKRLATWPFGYRLYLRRGRPAPTPASTAHTPAE